MGGTPPCDETVETGELSSVASSQDWYASCCGPTLILNASDDDLLVLRRPRRCLRKISL